MKEVINNLTGQPTETPSSSHIPTHVASINQEFHGIPHHSFMCHDIRWSKAFKNVFILNMFIWNIIHPLSFMKKYHISLCSHVLNNRLLGHVRVLVEETGRPGRLVAGIPHPVMLRRPGSRFFTFFCLYDFNFSKILGKSCFFPKQSSWSCGRRTCWSHRTFRSLFWAPPLSRRKAAETNRSAHPFLGSATFKIGKNQVWPCPTKSVCQ